MKKALKIGIALTVSVGMMSNLAIAYGGPRYNKGNRQTITINQKITEADRVGLIHMVEEEKLAHDVYTYLYKKWNMPVFERIARSESNHIRAIRRLLSVYGITDPTTGKENGKFKSQKMQKLYEQLTKDGSKSRIDALKIGATIEDLDIYDLEKYIKNTDNSAIKRVYSNLTRGSRNHLRIFISELKNLGATYTPQYISKEEFDKILSSPIEKGNHQTRGKLGFQ
ncbi:DUF2202 domain-containing protein [Hippea alviniae]|uniref:DUF2202 domain-containing protein n=1 Tax=Hippea alviniae TaxID=1279027 RepID=UPI0003B46B89|nr:DUF2202 domain-containing protein [Hippea alviniae]